LVWVPREQELVLWFVLEQHRPALLLQMLRLVLKV
jgi:hypothetical protein